jgi:hypothetical protein
VERRSAGRVFSSECCSSEGVHGRRGWLEWRAAVVAHEDDSNADDDAAQSNAYAHNDAHLLLPLSRIRGAIWNYYY